MNDESANDLGRRLRARRHGEGLTLQDVAARTGISASFLSLVERGLCDIGFQRLCRLAEAYEVSVARLVDDGDGRGEGR
jgi:transcriptional regulator with XRE-family HTH domain